MTDEQKRSFTLRISQANRSKLVVIVYEMLLVYTLDARAAIENSNDDELKESIRKAKGCIDELINGLDESYDISKDLFNLYAYIIKEFVRAQMKHSTEALDNIVTVVTPLKDSFAKISQSDDSEPLMSNTQSVVAGYTYGRGDVNEAVDNDAANRGFFA